MNTCNDATRSTANPGSTLMSVTKLRTSNPAPISRTTASAISVTTRALRKRWLAEPATVEPVSFRVRCRFGRENFSAGAIPKSSAVKKPTAVTKMSVVPSTLTCSMRGISPGLKATSRLTHQRASRIPIPHPRIAISKLSVSSCRSSLPRPAPIAARIANSRSRSAPRASRRFAMFVHAIKRTKATAPRRIKSASRHLPFRCSGSVIAVTPMPVFVGGCSAAKLPAIPVISARACSIVTPGFKRPTTLR